jgi:hypothetical protein
MVRYVLLDNGFDEPSQLDFVDNTVVPALKAHDTNIIDRRDVDSGGR